MYFQCDKTLNTLATLRRKVTPLASHLHHHPFTLTNTDRSIIVGSEAPVVKETVGMATMAMTSW